MLESQFGEKVGDKMKIAIMTSMLPLVLQDFVYQNVTRDLLLENLLEKIGVWVGDGVAMNEEVTPMDVGEVGWSDYNESEDHVDAVGAWSRCNRCDGWGHFARDCPSKGKVCGTSARTAARGTTTVTATSRVDTRATARTTSTRATAREARGRRAAARVTRELVGGAAWWDTRPTSARSRSRRSRR